MEAALPEVTQEVLAALGIEGRYVLAVGTLEPRKNLSRLLDAHMQLPEALRARFPLMVAGGGGWKNEELTEKLATVDHVRHLGAVDRSQLTALYTGAALFVYPSIAEGFGLPILEAMACGTPVLTSNTTSMPEIAGGAALLVDPHDTTAIARQLEQLLTDSVAVKDLSERGLARAQEFSWEKTARATLDVYRAALGGA